VYEIPGVQQLAIKKNVVVTSATWKKVLPTMFIWIE
jgi:hypothetical protein